MSYTEGKQIRFHLPTSSPSSCDGDNCEPQRVSSEAESRSIPSFQSRLSSRRHDHSLIRRFKQPSWALIRRGMSLSTLVRWRHEEGAAGGGGGVGKLEPCLTTDAFSSSRVTFETLSQTPVTDSASQMLGGGVAASF